MISEKQFGTIHDHKLLIKLKGDRTQEVVIHGVHSTHEKGIQWCPTG